MESVLHAHLIPKPGDDVNNYELVPNSGEHIVGIGDDPFGMQL